MSQGVGDKYATKAGALEDETDDAALDAFDASPLTVVEALMESVEEFVVGVSFGLESEEGDGVGW